MALNMGACTFRYRDSQVLTCKALRGGYPAATAFLAGPQRTRDSVPASDLTAKPKTLPTVPLAKLDRIDGSFGAEKGERVLNSRRTNTSYVVLGSWFFCLFPVRVGICLHVGTSLVT